MVSRFDKSSQNIDVKLLRELESEVMKLTSMHA